MNGRNNRGSMLSSFLKKNRSQKQEGKGILATKRSCLKSSFGEIAMIVLSRDVQLSLNETKMKKKNMERTDSTYFKKLHPIEMIVPRRNGFNENYHRIGRSQHIRNPVFVFVSSVLGFGIKEAANNRTQALRWAFPFGIIPFIILLGNCLGSQSQGFLPRMIDLRANLNSISHGLCQSIINLRPRYV